MARENNRPSDGGDMSWMDAFTTPTRAQFQRYLGGQQNQLTPMIRTLRRQLAGMRRQGDPTVKAYEALLAGVPTNEAVSGAFQGGLQNVSNFIQNLDMARGARGVSDIVGTIGGALGVEGAGDVAQAAGTVSGMGAAGGDVMSKAIMAGAAGQFADLETQRLGQLAEQRQGLTMGAAEARKGARQERQELARMLAELRGQRRAAAPNPFDVANMLMQFQQNRRAMGGGGYGGGSGSVGRGRGRGRGRGNGDDKVIDVTSPEDIERFITEGKGNEYIELKDKNNNVIGILTGGSMPDTPGRPAPGRR
jgi:hypothetical protein